MRWIWSLISNAWSSWKKAREEQIRQDLKNKEEIQGRIRTIEKQTITVADREKSHNLKKRAENLDERRKRLKGPK